jgi:peptidoglycan-associated lipoprotein
VKPVFLALVLLLTLPLVFAAGCAKKARPAGVPVEEPMVGEPEVTEPEATEPEPPTQVMEMLVLDDVHFDFDMYNIRPDARETLLRHAEKLQENTGPSVLIEGHCDERGTSEYNIALGERRARSTREFLVSYGIDASRLSTLSYGEERPLDPGHDEESWARNRRAHFVIEGGY